ncbi:MAG TPA: sulfotransferase [Caulobacteraceae bacterium]
MSAPASDPPIPADTPSLTFAQALALAQEQLAAGGLAAAEELCLRVLTADPGCAPALHLLGVILSRAGDLPRAIDLVRRATQVDGTAAVYFGNLCELCRLAGQLDDALAAGLRAIEIAPSFPPALNNLAIVHFERCEYGVAAELYRRAVALAPDYAEAHNNLGNVLRTTRQHDAALAAFGRALALRPLYADALNNLGTTLRDMGRIADAESAYRKAHALNPLGVKVLTNLARAVIDLDRPDEATRLIECALSLDPACVEALTCLARLRLEQRRVGEAEVVCREALAVRADDPEALNALGLVHGERGELDEALALFRRAIEGKPDLAEAHSNAGNMLTALGQLARGREAHLRAVALNPRQPAFYLNLVNGEKITRDDDPYLARMEDLAKDIDRLAPPSAIRLHFALAKANDDLGRHDQAFEHLLSGNRLERAGIAYDETSTFALFDRIRASFDGKCMAPRAGAGDSSELPVFVLGMPRSGTTLVEQIIASHPLAHGAGELGDLAEIVVGLGGKDLATPVFPESIGGLKDRDIGLIGARYVQRLRRHSKSARRISDKMPANYFFVGLIHLALPNARIIHVMRDPADTCLSCFSKLFATEQNHTYDLAELGRYYRKYAQLMEHWREVLPPGRMLEIRYEDVVADLEGSARRLIEHCGLRWNPRCLAFHETSRPVRTASAHQVRRPLYATSLGRWESYRAHLAPLVAELGAAPPGPL